MDLAYQVQGEGKPILLIHSPGVDSREWKYVVPQLARSHKVITFDGRGTGRSPAPHKPIHLVEDIRALLEHLEIKKATLVGHSMGGQGATEFALTYPSMVDRLVLIAPSLTGFPYSQAFVDWMNKVNSAAPDIEKLVQLSLEGPNYRMVMAGPHRDFFREMTIDYMTKVFTEWKNFEVIWPEPPAMERLEQIQAKTLFVYGTVEWDDMTQVAKEFKRVPSVEFAKIEDADHMLTLTHAEELASRILRFQEN